jgi:hypothetical protein
MKSTKEIDKEFITLADMQDWLAKCPSDEPKLRLEIIQTLITTSNLPVDMLQEIIFYCLNKVRNRRE